MAENALQDLMVLAEEKIEALWSDDNKRIAVGDPVENVGLVSDLFDRLTQIGVELLRERPSQSTIALFADLIDVFARLYTASDAHMPELYQRATKIPYVDRWYEVLIRLYVLGAAAVRYKRFEVVPGIVLAKPEGSRPDYLWLREIVTALFRQDQVSKGAFEGKSVLGPIATFIVDRPTLVRAFGDDRDKILTILCQFDFLQCVVTVGQTMRIWSCYPNFGAYWNDRTEPIIADLVNGPARQAVPGMADDVLAAIINALDVSASHAFFDVAGWHGGFRLDTSVAVFLLRLADDASKIKIEI